MIKQECFAIEHEKTRQSLKDAFDDLFARYDREFDDEDEIDIVSLKVVKKGGFLARSSVNEFGECYKKNTRKPRQSAEDKDEDGTLDDGVGDGDDDGSMVEEDISEKVFERVCKRVKKSQAIARLGTSIRIADYAAHFVPESVLYLPIKTEWKGQYGFDSVLYSMVKGEYRSGLETEKILIEKRACVCDKCFDCILLKEIIR